tara:strand:+ start:387 stop:1346 length:960 start_codon:yes stop_codon:yes gene_type:complete
MSDVNICILGAGGQLGSKLVHKFSNNKKINVYAVDKFFKYKYSNVSYVDLDVKNDFDNRFEIIPNQSTVFIDCIGLQHSFLSKKIMFVNYELNKKLFDYIRYHYKDFHFIYISSLSVDNGENKKLYPGVGKPINIYGKSKLQFENYLYENKNDDFRSTIIRPAAFYDKDVSKNLFNFFDLLINKIFILPRKKIKRSFLSLEYFADFLEEYILNGETKSLFELGDKNPIEFRSLINFIKNLNLNTTSKIFFIPTFLFKIAGYIGFLFEKLGLHIGFLTILGEFGYSFVASNDVKLNQREKLDTYENFENIIMKLFNSAEE